MLNFLDAQTGLVIQFLQKLFKKQQGALLFFFKTLYSSLKPSLILFFAITGSPTLIYHVN